MKEEGKSGKSVLCKSFIMLSFLYNVMNVSALNEQFRADPVSVMNSFGLSEDDQKAISDYNQDNVEGVLAALKAELIADRMAFW